MDKDELYHEWASLLSLYTQDIQAVQKTFDELVDRYSSKNRHYHNLIHIGNLIALSKIYENKLTDPMIVRLAIFYHDSVYKTLRSDNEEKSAKLAHKRLASLSLPEDKIGLIKLFISCTKRHEVVECRLPRDLEFFLDFDLSILGGTEKEYELYTNAIRREYKLYPRLIYNPGRKKVLTYLLNKPYIYHSEELRALREKKARINLTNELRKL